jgi:nitroimidazol reductase NimA-like FMN-containing flavoprotein (pyridoxamine 5'-phosphate oxidase superfamily)
VTSSEPGSESDGMEILDEHHCLEYLHGARIGRIAFQAGENIEILPINYAADGAVVVFRTASGTILERALIGRVAFEVDGRDVEAGVAWSVVLKGVADEITKDIDPFAEALRARQVRPLAPGQRERWIGIYPSEISGRRFRLPNG